MDNLKVLQDKFYSLNDPTKEDINLFKSIFNMKLANEKNELIISELNRMMRAVEALELCVPHG